MAIQTFTWAAPDQQFSVISTYNGDAVNYSFDPRFRADPTQPLYLGFLQFSPNQITLRPQRTATVRAALSDAVVQTGTLTITNPVAGTLEIGPDQFSTASSNIYRWTPTSAQRAWWNRFHATGNTDHSIVFTIDDGVPPSVTQVLGVGRPVSIRIGIPGHTGILPFPHPDGHEIVGLSSNAEQTASDLIIYNSITDPSNVFVFRTPALHVENDGQVYLALDSRWRAVRNLYPGGRAVLTVNDSSITIPVDSNPAEVSFRVTDKAWTDANFVFDFMTPIPDVSIRIYGPTTPEFRPYLPQYLATSRPHGFAHAEFILLESSVGRPVAQVKRAVRPITQTLAVSRPNGQRLTYAEPFPASLTWDLGARNRTRTGGTIWEWNDDDVTLPPPFGTDAERAKDRTRIGSDRILITGPGNQNLGFTDLFSTTGSMTLSSPAVGSVTFQRPRFTTAGRFSPSGDAWTSWWSAFSADAANELSIRFDIPGPRISLSVGRPLGVKDRTKYGTPLPITQTQAVGRPVRTVFGRPRAITAEQSVGRPRGYIPKVAAEPIRQALRTGRPHAFSHAEFIALVQSVGRPGVSTTRAVRPIAQSLSVGRPLAYGTIEAIRQVLSVGRPRGYIPKVAAYPITQTLRTGRPHGFAHAEFVALVQSVGRPVARVKRAVQAIGLRQALGRPIALVKRAVQAITQAQATGRPAAILFGVPGSSIGGGATTTESHNFGARTLVRPDANATWQFNANLTLPEPIMTSSASPITQAHVRANQLRFITTGGANPGFSAAYLARGRTTWTRVGGSSFTVVGAAFDHIGRYDPSGDDGYAEWWAEFSASAASNLSVTWELESDGFQPVLVQQQAVGQPEGRTRIIGEAMPIRQVLRTGRPHAFAHAEFVAQYLSVGRPGVSTSRAVRPIRQSLAVGRPHGFAHAEFVAQALSVGRPRGYIPKVAAETITQTLSVSIPDGVKRRFAVGKTITQAQAVGRPRALRRSVGLQAITTAVATGRPIARVKRAVQAIALALRTGRPHPFARGASLAGALSVGRPRGYIPKVAASPIRQSMAVGRPHAFAHAEFVALEQSVGRPRAVTTRAVRPITQSLAVGRPHAYSHTETIVLEQSVGRPRGYIPKVAAFAITLAQAVGRPASVRLTAGRPISLRQAVSRPIARVTRAVQAITILQSVGRPHALAHAAVIALEQSVGRPIAFVSRAVRAITATLATSRPEGIRKRIGHALPITYRQSVGRPLAPVPRAVRPITQAQAVSRPAAVLYGSARPVRLLARAGPARGYIPAVAAHSITQRQRTGRPVGERLRSGSGLPITTRLRTGRPIGYRPAVARPITQRLAVGRADRYFPRRNPKRQADADAALRSVRSGGRLRGVRATARLSA